MRRVSSLQVVFATLGLVFLWAHAAEAYGLHGCPHHHPPGAASTPEPPPPAGQLLDAGTDAPAPAGPCTCVGTCHGSAAPPVLGLARPPVLPAPRATTGLVRGPHATDRKGRDAAYLLPWPTGPPTPLSA